MGKYSYTIAAVFEDLPMNSHLKINMLLPIQNVLKFHRYADENPWRWTNFRAYLKLNNFTTPAEVVSQLNDYVKNEKIAESLNYYKIEYDIKTLTSIHLSGGKDKYEANNNFENILLLLVIGIMILIVAWVNYFNISLVKLSGDKRKTATKNPVEALRYE